jgi:ATP-dependent helicase/nuclease subunit A
LCYYTGLYKKFNVSDLKDIFIYDKAYGIIIPYFKEGIGDTIYKELLKNKYLREEISEKIRLFYVALTRAREKMILVMPKSDNYTDNNNVTVLPDSLKEGYSSLKDIIDSVIFRIEDKYIDIDLEKENLTKDYKLINIKNYQDYLEKTTDKIEVLEIDIPKEKIETNVFSKKTNKLITKDERKKMDLGTNIHKILELIDFNNPDYNLITDDFYKDKVKKLLESDLLKDKDKVNVYKEYEFIYNKDNIEYHGIVDLMVEYSNYINIIDYKLKNINDENYNKQLKGYQEYIERVTNKKVNTYLYSIIDSKFTKLQ